MEAYFSGLCNYQLTDKAKKVVCAFFCCRFPFITFFNFSLPQPSLHFFFFFLKIVSSFLPGYGPKPHEGSVIKMSGGRKNEGYISKKARLYAAFQSFHEKWIVIGESFVALFDSIDAQSPKEVTSFSDPLPDDTPLALSLRSSPIGSSL